MGNSLNVEVLGENGRAVEGAKVTILIDGIFSGGRLEEFTDDDGHAEFETADDYEDSRELTIRVRGQTFGPYRIGGGAYTVQLE
jgi:hypothetical protein